MTLIACLHPNRQRVLVADTLITASTPDPIALPLQAYIAPEQLRRSGRSPISLHRKVIEINPYLVALWAGDFEEARRFADRARSCFNSRQAELEDMERFNELWYPMQPHNFWAIIAPAGNDWWYQIGPGFWRHSSPSCGEYVVTGKGAEDFMDFAQVLEPPSTGQPLMAGLHVVSELMAYEARTSEPIAKGFGACYEVLYLNADGFERVDDILHHFLWVVLFLDGGIQIREYPHLVSDLLTLGVAKMAGFGPISPLGHPPCRCGAPPESREKRGRYAAAEALRTEHATETQGRLSPSCRGVRRGLEQRACDAVS
jgi:hypothetical protein